MMLHLPLIAAMAVVQWGTHPLRKNRRFKFERRTPCSPRIPYPRGDAPLPKSLAPVRSAVVSLLRPRHHFSNLYTATDIAEALDVAANVSGNPAIDRGVDASLVLRAFAFDGMDEIFLSLKDVFGYWRNPHGLYVRKPVRAARNDGGVLVIGRFATIEEARSSRMLAQKLLANME